LTPYDRVMSILNGKGDDADRIPCMNSASTCTLDFMKRFDAFWPESHSDPEKMARLASAAHRQCGLDNVSVPFDMTVEAEVLGAPIDFGGGSLRWPSAKAFVVKNSGDLKRPEDISRSGRIPVVTSAIKKLKKEFEGKVIVNAYLAPPFTSVSSYLVDTYDFLTSLVRKPAYVHRLLDEAVNSFAEIALLYEEAGADVITLHEMGGSNSSISPSHFEEFVKPYLEIITSKLSVPSILNICGSAQLIAGKMAECGVSAISVDEKTSIRKARESIKTKQEFPIIGNVSSRGTIYRGPSAKIREAVKDVISQGVDIVAPGCDFWIETPTEHIKEFVKATVEFGSAPN
jgi:[methyl-Co(III) methanol-specific corrinoid protein]:coenzyme M methyltransferase